MGKINGHERKVGMTTQKTRTEQLSFFDLVVPVKLEEMPVEVPVYTEPKKIILRKSDKK